MLSGLEWLPILNDLCGQHVETLQCGVPLPVEPDYLTDGMADEPLFPALKKLKCYETVEWSEKLLLSDEYRDEVPNFWFSKLSKLSMGRPNLQVVRLLESSHPSTMAEHLPSWQPLLPYKLVTR